MFLTLIARLFENAVVRGIRNGIHRATEELGPDEDSDQVLASIKERMNGHAAALTREQPEPAAAESTATPSQRRKRAEQKS